MTNKVMMAKRLIEAFVALMLGKRVPVCWSDHASIDTNGQMYLPTPKTGDPAEVALLTRLAVHEGGHQVHTESGFAQRLSSEEMALFNALEDPRMESAQSKDYPGASVILSRGLDEMLQTLEENLALTLQRDPRRAVQLDLLVRGFLQVAPHGPLKARGPHLLELLAPVITEQQREAIDEAVTEIAGLQNSRETEDLARSVVARLREVKIEPPPPPDEEGQDQQNEQNEQDEQDEQDQQDQQAQQAQQDPQAEPDESADQDRPSEQGQQGQQGQPGQPAEDDQREKNQQPEDAPAQEGGHDQPASDDRNSQQGAPAEDHAGDQQEREEGGSDPQPEGDGNESDAGSGNASGDECNAAPGAGAGSSDGAAGEANAAGGSQPADAPQVDAQVPGEQQTEPAEPVDLGTLLREVLVARYGAPSDDEDAQNGVGEVGPATDKDVERLGRMLAAVDTDASLEELLEASLAVLDGTGGDQGQPSDGDPGLGAGMSLAFEAAGEASVIDTRLQGVQSRLVTVLQRELQDKRRRPTRPAHAGQRVLPQRFWRLGALGDTKIFAQRRMAHGIDAAATLLLDSSGSMADGLAVAAEIAIAFSLALQRLGVRTKVVRFPGTETVTETLQRFGESPRACVRRCASLVADGGTPVGAAVEIERQALLEQRRLKNFLAVITDDEPGDAATLLAALALAYKLDVMVVGVGIGCDIRAWIPNSVSVSAVTELPDALSRLFREKLSEKLAA
jgi:hypothetical protein